MRSAPKPRIVRCAAPRPLLVAALLAVAVAAPGEPPRRVAPLDGPLERTASFGEFRGDHLHAGIDFATGRETGRPVRVVADGKIVRVKVEWRGYGNALYVEHAGGDVSLYGHLESFAGELGLEPLIAAAREKKANRYPGDVYPGEPIPVRAGQVIGYSGESGAGMPHLHFEWRRGGAEPVDPATAGIPTGADEAVPLLGELRLLPATLASRVEGSPLELRLPFRQEGPRATLARPVRIAGAVRLAVTAHDPTPPDHRTGVAAWRLEVDGRPVASSRLVQASFRTYFLAASLYDATESSAEAGIYSTWLSPPPAGLFGPANGPALLDLSPGSHRIEVTVVDPAGRESTGVAELLVAPAAPRPSASAPKTPTPPRLVGARSVEGREDGLAVVLPNNDEPAGASRVAPDGRRSALAVVPSPGGAVVLLPEAAEGAGSWIELPDGERLAVVRSTAAQGARLDDPQGPLSVALPKGELFAAVVDPTLLVAGALPPAAAARPGRFPRHGSAIRIGPEWTPSILGTRFVLREEAGKRALFRWDAIENRWIWAGPPKRSGSTLDWVVRRAGTWALFEDDRPPVLFNAGLFREPKREGLAVDVYDPETGLDRDGVVAVTVDGTKFPGDLDPDRGIAVWSPAPAGLVRIEATDRAGNRAVLDAGSPPLPGRPRLPPAGTSFAFPAPATGAQVPVRSVGSR